MAKPCPICGQVVSPGAKSAPFCSERCRHVDFSRWMSESYPVPVETNRVAQQALDADLSPPTSDET